MLKLSYGWSFVFDFLQWRENYGTEMAHETVGDHDFNKHVPIKLSYIWLKHSMLIQELYSWVNSQWSVTENMNRPKAVSGSIAGSVNMKWEKILTTENQPAKMFREQHTETAGWTELSGGIKRIKYDSIREIWRSYLKDSKIQSNWLERVNRVLISS